MKRSPASGWGRVASWACLMLAAGCPADAPRADGAACASDDQCASGMCFPSICLDPDGDADGDGLSNAEERAIGSDPTRADTDGDGLTDAAEVGPDVNAPRDTDGDGRADVLESAIADVDLDCINDQFDPVDGVPETDLAVVARTVCRSAGPCAPPGLVTVSCLRSDVDGGVGSRSVCDYSAVPGYEGGVELSCDGVDNDCDGRVDEDLGYLEPSGELRGVGAACAGAGACAALAGTVECGASGAAICSVNRGGSEFDGVEVDVDCDRVDNDCDGRIDEGVAWLEPDTGETRLSGEPCAARGVCGLTLGVVECAVGSTQGICSTEPGASDDQSGPEVCDGADNDCDGEVDEGIAWSDGFGRSLAVGESCGIGACAGGVVVCAANGGATCSSLALGSGGREGCDGIDEDCDGVTDEVEGLALACPVVGVCEGITLRRAYCGEDGLVCEFDPIDAYRPGAERWCDGRDDNCDGETDEGFVTAAGGLALGAPCGGQGACEGGVGVVVCGPDRVGAVCSADLEGTVEVCNGVDDDCDGTTDLANADLPGGGVCAVAGVCAGSAAVGPSCAGGAWVCAYVDDPDWEEVESRCDGLDNDCDGLTDAGLPRLPNGGGAELAAAQPEGRASWPVVGAGGEVYLFGGLVAEAPELDGAGGGGGASGLGDLWRYAEATHAWIPLGAEAGPGPRAGHALAWEPTHGVLLVHGGFDSFTDASAPSPVGLVVGGALGDLRVYDPDAGAWATVAQEADGFAASALARRHHALVALGGARLMLHGGWIPTAAAPGVEVEGAAPVALSGVLEQDAAADGGGWRIRWQALAGAPARAGHRLVAVPEGGVTLVGGVDVGLVGALDHGDLLGLMAGGAGADAGGAFEGPRVYRWGGDAADPWVAAPDVALGDPAWWAPGAALDADGDLVVVAGGRSWRLGGGGAWEALGGLSADARGAVVVTGAGEVRLVDVGRDGVGGRATWRLSGASWQGASRWAGPEPRVGAALVAHPGGWGTWLFGGARGPEGAAVDDVWRLDPESGTWEAEVFAPAPWDVAGGDGPTLVGNHGVWDEGGERFVLLGAAGALWGFAPGAGALGEVTATGDGPGGERARAFAADGAGGAWSLGEAASGGLALRRLDLASAHWTKRWDASSGGGPQQLGAAVAAGVAEGQLWLVSVSTAGIARWSYDLALDVWSGPVSADGPGIDPTRVAGLTWDPGARAVFAFVDGTGGARLAWIGVADAGAGWVSAPWARSGMGVAVDPVHGVVGFGGAAQGGAPWARTLTMELACPGP